MVSDDSAPWVVKPVRNQLSLQPMDLEALVPEDHPARGIWGAGRAAGPVAVLRRDRGARRDGRATCETDPAVLLALWIFANSEGNRPATDVLT